MTSGSTHADAPGDFESSAAKLATSKPPPVPISTRLVVWCGFLLGLVASVLANVLDAWLPAVHQSPGWTPGLAPQVGAAS